MSAVLVDGNGVQRPRTFSMADLAQLPRTKLTVRGHHDTSDVSYSGVKLSDLLRSAGVWNSAAPRGAWARTYVLVSAADGYQALFALSELDTMVVDKVVLLADHKNGAALDTIEGPLRLIAPGEKREGRWVRQVRALIVRRANE